MQVTGVINVNSNIGRSDLCKQSELDNEAFNVNQA